jgi:hypothetical protein
MREVLNRVIQKDGNIKFFQYSEFDAIKEIGAGGYGTVYKAECKSIRERVVVLKRFKNFDWMPELFIAEVNNPNYWAVIYYYNVIYDLIIYSYCYVLVYLI